MKTIVITGGVGFIGSHLCERLLKEGNKVIAVDNFVTGNKANVNAFLSNENFSLIEHDITKPLEIEGEVDQIFNMASPASPVDFPRIPIEILLTNSLGTKNVLDFAVSKNARILQASTSEVYGNPLEHPQKETYFGNEGKRFSEALLLAYKRKKNADIRIVRIFNTYGPRMRPKDGRVMPNFINQALEGKPLTVYGDGSQTRSFCFVSDEADGLIKLMNSNYNKPVNVGNSNEMTIKQLAELVIKQIESKSEIAFEPLPGDDPAKRKPDISLAKKELGWEPKISLEEGLAKTIDWFRQSAGK